MCVYKNQKHSWAGTKELLPTTTTTTTIWIGPIPSLARKLSIAFFSPSQFSFSLSPPHSQQKGPETEKRAGVSCRRRCRRCCRCYFSVDGTDDVLVCWCIWNWRKRGERERERETERKEEEGKRRKRNLFLALSVDFFGEGIKAIVVLLYIFLGVLGNVPLSLLFQRAESSTRSTFDITNKCSSQAS